MDAGAITAAIIPVFALRLAFGVRHICHVVARFER
jgi:hypothetical protein